MKVFSSVGGPEGIESGSLTRSPLALGLIGSLLVHAMLWTAWPELGKQLPIAIEVAPFHSHEVPVEVTDLPKRASPPAQVPVRREDLDEVVQTERVGSSKPPVDSRRLGERDQTVEHETRAARVDDFSAGARREGGEAGTGDVVEKELEHLTLNDLGIGTLAGSVQDGVGGLSASTDDKLEGVAVGERTALNTREFRYFSFYNRVKEELRLVWKPEVERRAQALASGPGASRLADELVTKLVAKLDAEGHVVRVMLMQSSGVATFDEAARVSFAKVGRFPNPPQAMVDRDGFVRLHWEFIVHPTGARSLGVSAPSEQNRPREKDYR